MSAETESRPLVGLTGARFGNARRRAVDRLDPPSESPAAPSHPGDPIGQTGARFGGGRRRRRDEPEPADLAPTTTTPVEVVDDWTSPPVEQPAASVRPYVLTGGRTRSSVVLALETLVSAALSPLPGARLPRTHEHHAAFELCREPRSVAEVAALLGVPLGVAVVLLGDLATAGLIDVHGSIPDHGPDLALLERVLHGLHRL